MDELVLISRESSIEKIEGESLDIYDAMAAMGTDISIETSSNMELIQDSDVIVLTAGLARKKILKVWNWPKTMPVFLPIILKRFINIHRIQWY